MNAFYRFLAAVGRRWPFVVAAGLALLVGGLVGVSELEERDGFCTSCHLAPELTYHDRATAALEVEDPFLIADLASFHYWDDANFRCIDCHRGDDGLVHRGRVLALAAEDTVTWLTGRADQTVSKATVSNPNPNQETWVGPERYNHAPDILDAGCLKCHGDALTLVGFENHFHNKLPAARRAYEQTGQLYYPDDWPAQVGSEVLLQAEETILTCLDCHRGHVEAFEIDYFLDQQNVVLPACVQCHREVGQGPLDLIRR